MSPGDVSRNFAVNPKVLNYTDSSGEKPLRSNCKQLIFLFTLHLSLLTCLCMRLSSPEWLNSRGGGGGGWVGWQLLLCQQKNQTTWKPGSRRNPSQHLIVLMRKTAECIKSTSTEWKWRHLPFFSYKVKLTLACLCTPWVKRSKGSKWHFLLCRWKLKAL